MLISVWWSFYIDAADEASIPAALKDVEGLLGHEIRENGISNDEFVQNYADTEGREGLFQVDAWSFLEVKSIEQAVIHTLKQVQKLDKAINVYPFQPPPPEDEHEGFMSIYWWYNKEDRPLSHFLSTGVQLYIPFDAIWDKKGCEGETAEEKQHCLDYLERKRTRIIVTPPAPDNTKRNYLALYTVIVKASTHQKLMAIHWPKLEQTFPTKVTMTNLQKRPNNKGPFHFTVRQELNNVSEQEAMINCLSLKGGTLKLKLDQQGNMTWFGTANSDETPPSEWEGIVSFALTAI